MDTRPAAWHGPAILLSSLAQDLHNLIPFQSRLRSIPERVEALIESGQAVSIFDADDNLQ
jgi:hypothetical protein